MRTKKNTKKDRGMLIEQRVTAAAKRLGLVKENATFTVRDVQERKLDGTVIPTSQMHRRDRKKSLPKRKNESDQEYVLRVLGGFYVVGSDD